MGAVIRFPRQSARPPADPYACLRATVAEMFRSEAAAPASAGATAAGRPAAARREEEIGRVLRRIERRLSQIERLASSGRV